jgi:regulatory protein
MFSRTKPSFVPDAPARDDPDAPVSRFVTGTIPALREHPRKPGRYAVHVDGKSVATVNASFIHDANLTIGSAVDEAMGDRLLLAARKLDAFDRAAAALGRRARSAHELERWLLQRGFDRADVADAVGRLTELGALDDSQFARAFARSRALSKGMSRRRLQQELSRRGVPAEMADAAIADVMDEESVDERALLEVTARKKLAVLKDLDPDVTKRRLYGFLSRRGYAADDVAAVVRRLLAEPESDE